MATVQDHNDAVPVVLVHGWGGTYADTWERSALAGALTAARRPVVGIDLPGHGVGAASHDAADYADIADQLDNALPPDVQLDAVGFSLGGKLLLQIAARRLGRFRRLVIGGVGENLFRPEAGDAVADALLGEIPSGAPVAFRAVVEMARSSGNDLQALAAVIRRPAEAATSEQVASITAATLIVVGDGDGIAGSVEPLAAAMPNSQIVVLAGMDHLSTPSSAEFQSAAAQFVLG